MNLREEIRQEFLGLLILDEEAEAIEQLIKREQIGFQLWLLENYDKKVNISFESAEDAINQLLEIYNERK